MVNELKYIFEANEIDLFSWIEPDKCLTDGTNYAYWEGTGSILLQAHVDTVHKGFATNITFKNGVMSGKNLGADDRAGVYACFQLRKMFPNTPILLTSGEEIGGIGMDICCGELEKEVFEKVNMAIAIDRQGIGDYVIYNALPKQVAKYVERHGWHEAIGSFSDIEIFTDSYLIPSINVSCGYYHQHTKNEILLLDGLRLCINRIARMLDNPISNRYVSDKWGIKTYKTYDALYDKYYQQYERRNCYSLVTECPYCKSNNVQDYKEFYYCNECGEVIETYKISYK